MPSIAVQQAKTAVTAATAGGRLTVTSNAYLFPGTNAWLALDDGSLAYRIRILACIGTDTVLARRWPSQREPDGSSTHDQENFGAPRYGLSDFSAFNALAAHITMEAQTAPVDPFYAKRVVP